MLASGLICAALVASAATECSEQVDENNEMLLLQTNFYMQSPDVNSAEAASNVSGLEEVELDLKGEQSSSNTDFEPSGLTLVMMSRNHDRFPDLHKIIANYRRMPVSLLSEIILIWNDPSDDQSLQVLKTYALGEGVPLRIVDASVNSMNNRFSIWKDVVTDGVVIQDDDQYLEEQDLRCLISTWRANPQRLVGAQARLLLKENSDQAYPERNPRQLYEATYNEVYNKDNKDNGYSMLLPHPWITSKEYLRMYMEKHDGPELVDAMMNCDDIYMNAVVANFTRMAPVLVRANVNELKTGASGSAMWTSDPNWHQHRATCIEKVNAFYKDEPTDPTTGTVFRFSKSVLSCSE